MFNDIQKKNEREMLEQILDLRTAYNLSDEQRNAAAKTVHKGLIAGFITSSVCIDITTAKDEKILKIYSFRIMATPDKEKRFDFVRFDVDKSGNVEFYKY